MVRSLTVVRRVVVPPSDDSELWLEPETLEKCELEECSEAGGGGQPKVV